MLQEILHNLYDSWIFNLPTILDYGSKSTFNKCLFRNAYYLHLNGVAYHSFSQVGLVRHLAVISELKTPSGCKKIKSLSLFESPKRSSVFGSYEATFHCIKT